MTTKPPSCRLPRQLRNTNKCMSARPAWRPGWVSQLVPVDRTEPFLYGHVLDVANYLESQQLGIMDFFSKKYGLLHGPMA